MGLKVVALISGGKDSLFSILHCLANGHEVVALANLHPPLHHGDESVEDMDSYMYQTIGHAVIPLYKQALGLPLYRQEILGSAVNRHKSYGPSNAAGATVDETESLVPLLQKVKTAHPEVNAVSTGAILSDYQRTRVESVAVRLGLAPLSYLWQWPALPSQTESSLLEDMAAVGQDARIVKVASGGLDDSFLWQNVAGSKTIARLTKAAQRFGSIGDGAVLGEGGEYETIAVSGPAPLWKATIVLEERDRKVLVGEAGSASLRLTSPRVVPIEEAPGSVEALRIPGLLDEAFQAILKVLTDEDDNQLDELVSDRTPHEVEDFRLASSVYQDGDVIMIPAQTATGSSLAEQTRSIMATLAQELQHCTPASGLSDIVYTTLILRNMADFPSINSTYGKFFDEPNPPARVTIACADVLPEGCDVMLAATSYREFRDATKGLHVQSRSYWAPANIGPYSQARSIPTALEADVVYVAGQIPLLPASMELIPASTGSETHHFAEQAVLALQHLTRVGTAMCVRQWLAAIAFVTASSTVAARVRAVKARKAWTRLHQGQRLETSASAYEESDDFDIWDHTYGAEHGSSRTKRPSALTVMPASDGPVPPLWVIEVDALPRAASIEWAGYGTTAESGSFTTLRHLHHLLHTFRNRIL